MYCFYWRMENAISTIHSSNLSPILKAKLSSSNACAEADNKKQNIESEKIKSKLYEEIKNSQIAAGLNTVYGIDFDKPKKTLISIACSVAAVVVFGILGNKLTKPAAKLANEVDAVLLGDNILGKTRGKIADYLNKGLDAVKQMPKPKLIENAKQALKNPVKQKWNLFRGLENGAKGLFSNTIVETIDTAMEKNKDNTLKTLKNLFNGDIEKVNKLLELKTTMPKVQLADKLIDEIAAANNCVGDTRKLTQVFEKISNGKFGDGLINVKMDKGGFFGSWWPANFINGIYKKITKTDCKYLQADLGDSLIKYAAVRGKLAKTLPAKIIQIVPPLVGDQISNFVNDKSGFGIFLCLNLVNNFNNLQDAPKEKRVTTAVNDAVSGSLSWLINFPLAYGAIYSLASLSKMEGNDILTKLTRGVGKFVAIGLDKPGKFGGLSGVFGGLMRFGLFFFVFTPFIGKQINKLCAKIFGKPYDSEEAERLRKIQEEKNKIIPELGITQGELEEKIMNNPKAIQTLEEDSELAQKIIQNPKLLVDLLDGKEIKDEKPSDKKFDQNNISPLLKDRLNSKNC